MPDPERAPAVAHALSFSDTDLSWVLYAYTLTFGGLLLAARALQKAEAAVAAPSALALLTTMFSKPSERRRAIGLFTSISVGGGALGLITGGMLVEWAS